MSTNFYRTDLAATDPKAHIGKRVGIGNGQVGFLYSRPRREVESLCFDNLDRAIIRSEYGSSYTGREFMSHVVNHCVSHDERLAGHDFS